MRVHLKQEGVRSFRLLSELSLVLGVIAEETFLERIDYLHELLGDPGNRSGGASGDGVRSKEEGPTTNEAALSENAHGDILKQDSAGSPTGWLQFIPGGVISHLQRWRFIKGDPDPMPSVPHGHDEGRSFPKLDPYLGYIHASTTQIAERLSQDDTRALWNDDRFRDFASAALIHFVQENPSYTWRVPFPMRLPRRR